VHLEFVLFQDFESGAFVAAKLALVHFSRFRFSVKFVEVDLVLLLGVEITAAT